MSICTETEVFRLILNGISGCIENVCMHCSVSWKLVLVIGLHFNVKSKLFLKIFIPAESDFYQLKFQYLTIKLQMS